MTEDDASVFSVTYAARRDDPPFALKTWRKANPGLPFGMPDLDVLRAEARLARRDSGELATFRALRLNQGTSDVEQAFLVDALTWQGVEVDPLPPRDGPFSLGLDLGGVGAFSAAAAYWPTTGRLEGFVSCGNNPPLAERALADGVSGVYEAMRDGGELVQLGGKVVPVASFLAEAVNRYGKPQAIAADRYRQGDLEDAAKDARLGLPIPTWRGQGFRDGAQDVRAFQTAVLEGRVSPPVSLAMRAALAEARTVTDSAANEKLAKSGEGQHRRRGRDDLAAAIVLAVAEGVRREAGRNVRRWRYRGLG